MKTTLGHKLKRFFSHTYIHLSLISVIPFAESKLHLSAECLNNDSDNVCRRKLYSFFFSRNIIKDKEKVQKDYNKLRKDHDSIQKAYPLVAALKQELLIENVDIKGELQKRKIEIKGKEEQRAKMVIKRNGGTCTYQK